MTAEKPKGARDLQGSFSENVADTLSGLQKNQFFIVTLAKPLSVFSQSLSGVWGSIF